MCVDVSWFVENRITIFFYRRFEPYARQAMAILEKKTHGAGIRDLLLSQPGKRENDKLECAVTN